MEYPAISQVAEIVKSMASTEVPCGRPEGTSPTGSSVLLDSPGLGAQWEDFQKPHDAPEEQLESSIQSTEPEEVRGLSNFQLRVHHVNHPEEEIYYLENLFAGVGPPEKQHAVLEDGWGDMDQLEATQEGTVVTAASSAPVTTVNHLEEEIY